MLNEISFDWFSFTIKDRNVKKVFDDLGLRPSDFEKCAFGMYGYNSAYQHQCCDIKILFDGTDAMGVHVIVPGGSVKYFMDYYAARHGEPSPFGPAFFSDAFSHFAQYVLKHGRFSRVDVNIDTDMLFMSPFNLRDLAKKGDMISVYRRWELIEGSDGASTFYIGQKTSASFIRIYDKAKEQDNYTDTLYRFEVQFNNEASIFMSNFVNKGLRSALLSFLNRQLRFVPDKNYTGDSYPEWDEFLKLIFFSKEMDYTNYESKKRKTCINAINHMFRQYRGKMMEFFEEYGSVDDFFELMFIVFEDMEKNKNDAINYMHGKGWISE